MGKRLKHLTKKRDEMVHKHMKKCLTSYIIK